MRIRKAPVPKRREANLVAWSISSMCSVSIAAGITPPPLPTPCVPGACGTTGATQFVTGGAATAVATKNALTVNQTSNNTILNWSSFNIAAGNSVVFNQPGTSAIALNRIFQGSPSQIFGTLKSNGQVYLINLNGFLFGSSATVNVGSLVVSSLPLALTDATFGNGILSPLQDSLKPAFDATLDPLAPGVGRASVRDVNGNTVYDANGKPLAVQVVVQPGAQISAADQGRLLLVGQNVTNGGSLSAPDGQVVLAAGSQVFLQADADPTLRGLIVEVDANNNNTAWNQLTGSISAPRGNVTMVGLAVNQDGRISATTSVAANGSIRLEAADGAVPGGSNGNFTVASSQGGSLTIGPDSQMDILPETSSSQTAVAAQTQYQSSITLLGEQVLLQGGSIVAPDGTLTAIAAANPSAAAVKPSAGVATDGNAQARLRIDAGTAIDLSGSEASLPVTANLVAVQLRSAELADDPSQRDGPLHGLTVYVNARTPPPASLANVSGEIQAIPETIAQRTETGGTAIFESEGDIVFAKGASLNVSGGSSTYAGGILQTSYLVGANGALYPIASANPLLDYVGVLNPTFTQTFNTWGVQDIVPTPGLSSYQTGYVQGAAAGSVQFAAPNMVLQGALQGSAVNGLYQRTPGSGVAGGTLIIGVPGGIGSSATIPPIDYLAPGIRVTGSPTPVVVADDASLLGPQTLELPAAYLTSSGFTSTQIYTSYDFTLPGGLPLALPPGSTLSVNAARVDLLSNISSAGGTLDLQNVFTLGAADPTAPRPGVYVGDDVTLDVRGLYTNDALTPAVTATSQSWQNGGSIELGVSTVGALLSIGDDVSLRASGGAWINAKSGISAGSGGMIQLNDDALSGGFDVGRNLAVDAFGVDGAAGGTFALTAPRIELDNGTGGWLAAQQVDDATKSGGVLKVASNLFANFGFENVTLAAAGQVALDSATSNVLTVDPGTSVAALVSSLELKPGISLYPSAPNVNALASIATLPVYLRPAADVSLTALPPAGGSSGPLGSTDVGDIDIGSGASISTPAGKGTGSITLTGLDSIVVEGALNAPGGTVTLHVLSPAAVSEGYESGFLANQRIELGSGASINVSGTLVSQPSNAGLDLGSVLAGGTVNLYADRGAVLVDAGSLVSIGGVSAAFDLPEPSSGYRREVAATAGGSLNIHSGEAISLLGTFEAAGGSGGTSGNAAGGSLNLVLSRAESYWGVVGALAPGTFSAAPLTVELEPTVPSTVPPSAANTNQVLLGAAQVAQSGIDALRIESGNTVEFSGAFSLKLGRSLIIDSPVLLANTQAQASLAAPFMEVGYEPVIVAQNNAVPLLGTGSLSFSGAEIDLVGQTVFQGTSTLSFSSAGDLLLRGQALGTGAGTLLGGVTLAGGLALDAGRIYPATATQFSFDAVEDSATGTPGTVNIGQIGANPGTPFSAGGALSINAYSIASTGTLYAPFGTIALNATNGINLGSGSLTSVSGAGLTIPYGQTQYGAEQWLNAAFSGNQVIGAIPARAVNLSAASVSIAKGATIDLTGGGNLSAYEWVPGPGGSTDALAPYTAATATNPLAGVPGLYAILPGTRGQAAPQDPASVDNSILPGESVYISGGAGLAAGFYPLLPARYALVPGAYLIQVESSYQSTGGGLLGALANGTPVVAGYLSYGSTGLHQSPGYEGFALYPGGHGDQLAQYDVSLASNFFSAAASAAAAPKPVLPADAGALSIAVGTAFNAAGEVRTAPASGGVAASIAISANDLVVGTEIGATPADAVDISAAVLAGWQPGSLLLGGTFASAPTSLTSSSGVGETVSTLNVLANSVTIGSGTTLSADQITLVANQTIEVQGGATLQSTSAASGTAPSPPTVQLLKLSGTNANPALLAVSDLNWLTPVRSAGSPAAGAATVSIDAGATVASRGALSIDGTGGVALNGTVTGVGAEWSLGAGSIAIVPAGVQADALSLNPALIAQLGAAGAVRFAATGSIDVMTPVSLGVNSAGAPTLASLTLSAASLNNDTASPSTVLFGAHTLTLAGPGVASIAASPVAAPTAGPSGAQLSLSADELDVGPNALTVNGFANTQAVVGGAVIGQGAGSLSVGGNLSISAGGLTVAPLSATAISATGLLAVSPASGGAKLPQLLGGALSLAGGSIDIDGTIAAPSGEISVTSAGDVTLGATARLSTAGSIVTIGNQTASAPGGDVSIAARGAVTLNSGATLDVSGVGNAAAGALSLSAGGTAFIGPTPLSLTGVAGNGASGGSFALDAGSLAILGDVPGNALSLVANSLAAGGFTNAVSLRVRSGDLDLAAGSSLSANSITLTADSGRLTIGGEISAPSSARRGSLSIFGGNGVALSGALLADGSGAAGEGGNIEIGAGQLIVDQTGTLDAYNGAGILLNPGSVISAVGPGGAGTLLLRAPALQAAGDVAINAGQQTLGANMNVGQIIIEPVLPFNTANTALFSSASAPSNADFQNVYGAVSTYMSSASANIATRLAPSGATPLSVEAGVEIVASETSASNALTLPALDLSAWHSNGAPIDLTVRALGGLTVTGNLQDGFGTATVPKAGEQTVLLAGPSSSIRLVAGADLTSADPLAVVGAAPGLDLTVGAPGQNAWVRTGTGSIDLVAANDIVIGSAGSGAYTAGAPVVQSGATATNAYPGIPKQLGTGDAYGVALPGGFLISFPNAGGNLRLSAGGDIDGVALPMPSVSSWQLREGGSVYQPAGSAPLPTPPEWGVNLNAYNWNFGTLGGGDLTIASAGSINNVTAAAADNLLPPQGDISQHVASGGLSMTAGANIGSAEVYLADGTGSVVAGGGLTAVLPSPTPGEPNVGSAFFLAATTLNVSARTGLAVDGVFNPTALAQGASGTLPGATTGSFFTYGDNAALNLSTVGGSVVLGSAPSANLALLGPSVVGAASVGSDVLPPSLSIVASNGDILLGPGFENGSSKPTLYPAPRGQLDLLAARDINGGANTRLIMSDAPPGSYADLATPLPSTASTAVETVPFAGDIHSGDPDPALITAGRDIVDLNLSIPKAATIVAGHDITDLRFFGQNLAPSDQTLIMAGRDFTFTNGFTDRAVSVGGPGALDILAGRNINLGFSDGGVVTTGNLLNANLPTAQGADLTLVTGLGSAENVSGFVSTILAPSLSYQTDLVNYVESLQGSSGLSYNAAAAAFMSLAPSRQIPLVDEVFFNELGVSGIQANTVSGAGFSQGYKAIGTLFPDSLSPSSAAGAPFAGNLTLDFSRIYTLSGGNLTLIVPGGNIDVGLASVPAFLGERSASTLGIVTEGPGNIDIYAQGDVNVNSSRIFTLGGGNILIWSNQGSIDAGLGAKTSVSAPPPSILISSTGTVTLDFAGAAVGSGIRTIQTEPTTPPGNVELIAPLGTVNAGDAGIGSAGNIDIAARSVVGVNNISFGGTATGVPAQVGNIGAALAGASNAASGTSNAANNAIESNAAQKDASAPLAQTALSWLDVFVTGLGEENCKQDDIECLKRQKTPTR